MFARVVARLVGIADELTARLGSNPIERRLAFIFEITPLTGEVRVRVFSKMGGCFFHCLSFFGFSMLGGGFCFYRLGFFMFRHVNTPIF
jgi:hypothetical protein